MSCWFGNVGQAFTYVRLGDFTFGAGAISAMSLRKRLTLNLETELLCPLRATPCLYQAPGSAHRNHIEDEDLCFRFIECGRPAACVLILSSGRLRAGGMRLRALLAAPHGGYLEIKLPVHSAISSVQVIVSESTHECISKLKPS